MFWQTGTIDETIAVPKLKKLEKDPGPSQVMSKAEVYECFRSVKFGGPFRSVQEVRIWSDHADAHIEVSVTENPAHDRIPKLDACLHTFGAIASRVTPEVDEPEGAFLVPTIHIHPQPRILITSPAVHRKSDPLGGTFTVCLANVWRT